MKVRVTSTGWGEHEFHQVGCSHSKLGLGFDTYEIELEASTRAELIHALELWINEDFATDYDMTVEDYVSQGMGYQVGTQPGAEWRLFPCVKF